MSTITASNCDDYNCPLISDKNGEPDTLDIIQQFRQVYENKLKQIDKEGCSDALQLKLKIQQKWIDNLTEQTEMMARVVKELEIEAAERVQLLEDKLKRSAECASEVSLENPEMANYAKRLTFVKELLEKQYQIKRTNIRKILKLNEEIDCKNQILCNLYEVVLTLIIKLFLVDSFTNYKKMSMESYDKQETKCSCNEKVKKLEEDHQLEVTQLQSTISELRNQPNDEFERYLYFSNQESNPSNSLYKTAISDPPNYESTPSNSVYRTALSDFSNQESNPSNSLYKTALSDFSNQEPNRSKLEKKKKEKVLKDEIEKRQVEVDRLKEKCKQLEKNLANTKEQTENLQTAEKTVQSLNCNLEVLQQEKSVHETIISYLKNEISTMSDELVNLQGILEISNQTCRDENQQLVDTVANLEEINQRLQSQLSDSRLKLFHENEANLQKITQLELILQEKDADLVMHDQEIDQLTQNLNAVIKENQELKNKISHMYFQIYENSEAGRDNIIIGEFNEKIQMLEEENQRKIDELSEENNQLRQILDEAKQELEQIRDTKEMSRSELNSIREALQKKHEETKAENLSLSKKYEDIKSQLCDIAEKNQKELAEMKSKFDGILKEFKESLAKINKSLIDGKFAKNPSYLQKSCCCNLIDSCKSEIQLTGKLFESFKDKYVQLSDNFNEVTQQNNQLINTLQHKDAELSNTKQELQQTKRVKQQSDGYLNEILEFLRLEMKNVRDPQDFQPTTKQEEISLLKELIKEIFQEQIDLSKEKDRFLSQIDRLQTALNKHEDVNRLLNAQFEANHLELKRLLDNNKLLKQEKDDTNNELETLQNHCSCVEKRNRQLNEIVKNLELELIQSKVKRDDICAESKLVIDCVRVWLNEQKKINNEIQQRKFGSFKVQQHKNSQISSASTKATNCPAAPYSWNHCSRSDSVGSPASYSPDDDDDDDDDEDSTDDVDQDDDFIRRAKEITNQIRCSNQYFKSRFPNF